MFISRLHIFPTIHTAILTMNDVYIWQWVYRTDQPAMLAITSSFEPKVHNEGMIWPCTGITKCFYKVLNDMTIYCTANLCYRPTYCLQYCLQLPSHCLTHNICKLGKRLSMSESPPIKFSLPFTGFNLVSHEAINNETKHTSHFQFPPLACY